ESTTGQEVWRYNAGSLIRGIAQVSEGLIIVVTEKGKVVALQTP
ncbi:MAG: PQQ-binding-like beta-propeller repeat protein, partial [Armatimonadetes bacterium]|nr:PQQ-binding-like beta-propeller repeat protein [Armatimonadota bacterium]